MSPNIQNPSLTDCPQAVSAVKAIAIAASQGQKIYTITQKNAALALPKLALSKGVAEEIQNAVAAGKEVTVHEKAINAYGFSGFGYTVIDPETGVGGYLIEGKGSGGDLVMPGVLTAVVSVLAFIGVGIAGALTATFVGAILMYHVILGFLIAGFLLILAGIAEGTGNLLACNILVTLAASIITGFLLVTLPISFGAVLGAAALGTAEYALLYNACAGG